MNAAGTKTRGLRVSFFFFLSGCKIKVNEFRYIASALAKRKLRHREDTLPLFQDTAVFYFAVMRRPCKLWIIY
jgi:hypothetical protein